MNPSLLIKALVVAGAMYGSAPAYAGAYKFFDLGTLGGKNSFASDINNSGHVVGASYIDDTDVRAFLWTGSTMKALAQSYSTASSINDKGEIVGASLESGAATWGSDGVAQSHNYSWSPRAINNHGEIAGITRASGDPHAARWDGKTALALGTLGGVQARVTGLSDTGTIVGYTQKSGSHAWYATAWINDVAIDIGGGENSYAYGVNSAGQIVGYSQKNGVGHATLWSDGVEVNLSSDFFYHTGAKAINNTGAVVGYAWDVNSTSSPYTRATMWEGGLQIDLNSYLGSRLLDDGWILTTATGINDHGWVIGEAFNPNSGETHAYVLAREVPEPGTFPLTIMGMVLIGMIVYSRRNV